MAKQELSSSYRIRELEIAAFLRARSYKVLSAQLSGPIVEFEFAPEATRDVDQYLAGASIPARDLFEAHRALRSLIVQLKDHRARQSRSGEKWQQRELKP